MLSRSTSETPGIRAGSFTPGSTRMNNPITWIKDWYTPEVNSPPFQSNGPNFEPQSIKLKGWHKTNVDSNNDPAVKFDSADTLDLNNWKYYEEVTITDHSDEEIPTDNGVTGGDNEPKEELSSGLSIKNQDEEMVSLSGITDT